ncbi:MAG: PH domain-containing protein [Candidatus Hodarchaeales archaeon]|jgi:uncharacterized membrane protein YdbT with pleckstrin-like domain
MYKNTNEPEMVFKPTYNLLWKFYLYIAILWSVITIGLSLLVSFIFFTSENEQDTPGNDNKEFIDFINNYGIPIYFILSFIIIVILVVLLPIYVKSMEFQIWSHEIVVKKGLINKTEKHVPYRTVTNISTRYGIFDRIFGIGTVEIETAGKSGATAPEEKIEGINNYVEIRDIILEELRKFRSQYATGTELDTTTVSDETVPIKILNELRDIKNILKNKA